MRKTIEEELKRFPLTVIRGFEGAIDDMEGILSEGEIEQWAHEGTAIASYVPRSWEAATEYFRVSPEVARSLAFSDFLHWAQCGKSLIDQSPTLAISYFKASPDTVSLLKPNEIERWAELGRKLYSNSWKVGMLATQFFETSEALLKSLRFQDVEYLVYFVETLAGHSHEDASKCLLNGGRICMRFDQNDRLRYLEILKTIASVNWRVARRCFEMGPASLAKVDSESREYFLAVVEQAAYSTPEAIVPLLEKSADAVGQLDPVLQKESLGFAEEISQVSPLAAGDFMVSLPFITKRMKVSGLAQWVDEGLKLLEKNERAGNAFFRIESGKAEALLDELSSGVTLPSVRDVIRMYCKALTGANIQLQSTEQIAGKGIGWSSIERPTTDGTTVFLPPYLEEFNTKRENFETFKVLATHQTGHLEFGTFSFLFDRPSKLFSNMRPSFSALVSENPHAITGFAQFFDLFPNRKLAKDIYNTIEDARVDYLLRQEYRGIRRSFNRIAEATVARRPTFESMALQELLVELIIRMGLGVEEQINVPRIIARRVRECAGIVKHLLQPGATVEDSAECTLRLYNMIAGVPNIVIPVAELETQRVDISAVEEYEGDSFSAFAFTDDTPEEFFFVDPHRAVDYRSPDEVDFRGELKPELVQTLMKLRSDGMQDPTVAGSPVSLEALWNLLEKSAEIELSQLVDAELGTTSGLFITNMLREQGTGQKAKKTVNEEEGEATKGQIVAGESLQGLNPEMFLYDEWDFRAGDYKPQWCCVVQQVLEEGTEDFFHDTMSNYAGLVSEIRKQFELLKPEMFKKIKRLNNGEEFDLDAVIEALVEKKAGVTPSEKLYWRKNKWDRDVSVAFLLDMSASTDEEIDKDEAGIRPGGPPRSLGLAGDDMLAARLQEWMDEPPKEKGKRIIDVEKESIVLLIRALETIGDRYGIFGFSGNGRDQVDYYVIKDLDEPFNDRIKRRIDGIKPVQGTRMGAAIRHTIAKLDELDSRFKILILISDGRPQDVDYGMDRTERDYALQDTKMALNEALRKRIVPFCLTVDKSGTDWLKTMCGDIGYEIVDDIYTLPRRLPTLYRRLTT